MQIHFEDDGKEKWQSVTAKTSLAVSTHMGYAELYIEGLGRTEDEALRELMYSAKQVIEWIQSAEELNKPEGSSPEEDII